MCSIRECTPTSPTTANAFPDIFEALLEQRTTGCDKENSLWDVGLAWDARADAVRFVQEELAVAESRLRILVNRNLDGVDVPMAPALTGTEPSDKLTIRSASSGNGRCNALASSHGACIHRFPLLHPGNRSSDREGGLIKINAAARLP
ncbi:hypothetical protein M2171_006529 [Bradyrhizobium japonicum USDA 38]|uniref:hypothetical protein n=1 Tax=Bradyrhizobium japonicum TaxID=375 RepID=UPI0018AD300E|nr:hypothetical protein [Bradyrhizobium japonicum]MCS3897396.1 hypothetical protein [Bradyrhizobium japonicum USDA 38]MCS3949911.1 hypothetical protein [Bradyrhizobium japonicum]